MGVERGSPEFHFAHVKDWFVGRSFLSRLCSVLTQSTAKTHNSRWGWLWERTYEFPCCAAAHLPRALHLPLRRPACTTRRLNALSSSVSSAATQDLHQFIAYLLLRLGNSRHCRHSSNEQRAAFHTAVHRIEHQNWHLFFHLLFLIFLANS